MDSILGDFTGIAVMIGKGYLVAVGLFIAVIAWRWLKAVEVKHSPRIEDADND